MKKRLISVFVLYFPGLRNMLSLIVGLIYFKPWNKSKKPARSCEPAGFECMF